MVSEERTDIQLQGRMSKLFTETAERLGVDTETLALMAISNFLNSPVASSEELTEEGLASSPEETPSHAEKALGDLIIWEGFRNRDIEFQNIRTSDISRVDEEYILWGQFSRFLTIKLSLRILAWLSVDAAVPKEDWFDNVRDIAPHIRRYLRGLDVENRTPRGEQLASGFPKGGENSLNRFTNHFCADIQSSGKVVGFPAHLGLIYIRNDGDVLLTDAGLEYVRMSNPVIDEADSNSSMSIEEADFMIRQIEHVLPSTWGFFSFVMSAVAGGANSPSELSQAIDEGYGEKTTRGWNEKQVSTYRTGAIGLLGDLGLLQRSWKFRSVTYALTERGNELVS